MKTLADLRAWATVRRKNGCWLNDTRTSASVCVYAWLPGQSAPRYLHPRRAAWAYAHGGLPAPDLIVVPTCGASGCFNPDHARAVTRAEAGRMKAKAGSFRNQPARIAANRATGRRRSTLTPALVHEIQTSPETGRALVARLGLGRSQISRVRRGSHVLCSASPWAMLLPGVKIGNAGAKQC